MSPPHNDISLSTPTHWHTPIAHTLLDKIYHALLQRLNIVNTNYVAASLDEIQQIYSYVMLQLEELIIDFDNRHTVKTGDINQNQVALNILCFLQLFLERITTPALNSESAFAVILKTQTILPIDLALIFGGAISNKEKLVQQREAITNKTFTPIAAKQFYFLLLQLAISYEREFRHTFYNNEILDFISKELSLTLMPPHDQDMLNAMVANLPLTVYQDQNKHVERFVLGQFEKPTETQQLDSIATQERLSAKLPYYFGVMGKMGAKETLLSLIGKVSAEEEKKTPEQLWEVNASSRRPEDKTKFEQDLKFLRQVHKVRIRAAFVRTWQVEFWSSMGYGAYQRRKLPVIMQEWYKLAAGNGHNIQQMLADWTRNEVARVGKQLTQLFEAERQPLELEAKELEVKEKKRLHNVFILENRISALEAFNQGFSQLMSESGPSHLVEQFFLEAPETISLVAVSGRVAQKEQPVPGPKISTIEKDVPVSSVSTSNVVYRRMVSTLTLWWYRAQKKDEGVTAASITTTRENVPVPAAISPPNTNQFNKMSGA